MMKKIKIIGNIITIVALIFIFKKLLAFELNIEDFMSLEAMSVLGICTVIYIVQVLLLYVPWTGLLTIFTDDAAINKKNKTLFRYIYTKSNVLKYIPGNVFQYIGRNEIAMILNIKHASVAFATVAEICLTLLAAFMISFFCVGGFTIEYLLFYKESLLFVLLFLVLFLVFFIAVLYKKFNKKHLLLFEKYKILLLQKKSLKKIGFGLIYYILNFLLNAVQFLMILLILGDMQLSFDSIKILMGAFMLSWVLGYVTPGSPGGIGVREVIMTTVIVGSGIVGENVIMLAMVVYRVLNVVGDLAAFIIAFLLNRKHEVIQ